MLEPIVLKSLDGESPADASGLLLRNCFYFSILLFCYAALFPFSLDFSQHQLYWAWSHASFMPFWDTPGGRIHSLSDVMANILLTIPLGFFGFMYREAGNRTWAVWKWCALGLALGLAAEIAQLAVPTRSSGFTDVIDNGLGAFSGAAVARSAGQRILRFLTGTSPERRNIYLWMLVWSMVAILGPFDVSLDYFSRLKSGIRTFLADPWGPEASMGVEWVRTTGFALIGALASREAVPGRRKRSTRRQIAAVALVLLLPLVLQFARPLVESYPPSLRGVVWELVAASAGFLTGLFLPGIVRALTGFVLMNLTLIAAGLSPFRFVGWRDRLPFQWIPFYEYLSRRTPTALYEVILNLFSFAILGGLLQLSFIRQRRGSVVVYAVVLAAGIEFAQTFLPSRSPGVTDILMAGLAAWIGSLICAAVNSSRQITASKIPLAGSQQH